MKLSSSVSELCLFTLVVSLPLPKIKRDGGLVSSILESVDTITNGVDVFVDTKETSDWPSRTASDNNYLDDKLSVSLNLSNNVNDDNDDNSLNTATTNISNNVLLRHTYDQISISAGRAGNADKEAGALFSAINSENLAGISASDLQIIKNTHDIAQMAELEAFDPALASATGPEAEALLNGKIKNNVLKHMAGVLSLEIEQAQGGGDPERLEWEMMDLNTNIQTDKLNAGKPSSAVSFQAST